MRVLNDPCVNNVRSAAGLHRAEDSCFKLIHGSHAEYLAWHPTYGWTQFYLGFLYTYEAACAIERYRDTINGSPIGKRTVPDEGRWYWCGNRIYLEEGDL